MNFYKTVIRSILFQFSAERAHHLTFFLLHTFSPVLRIFFPAPKKHVPKKILGLHFKNPIGLAAGLDKDGKAFKQLGQLGFGFVEVGTTTPKAQPGNPKPRLFRLKKDLALINRMGFNNEGVDALALRLSKQKRNDSVIIGGNIGKNTLTSNEQAPQDYLYSFKKLYHLVDYFVVNVSCPNVKDLRALQNKDSLIEILNTLMQFRRDQKNQKPVLLKVSPDLGSAQLDELKEIAETTQLDGFIATNTTVKREGLSYSDDFIKELGNGGLSGKPILKRSVEVVSYLRKLMGKDFPIIASGGIQSASDAQQLMDAGADLVQIYTGFIYQGPKLIHDIVLIADQ